MRDQQASQAIHQTWPEPKVISSETLTNNPPSAAQPDLSRMIKAFNPLYQRISQLESICASIMITSSKPDNTYLTFLCLPLYIHLPTPAECQLEQLARRAIRWERCPWNYKQMMKAVRAWFRKRRSNDGLKIFAACRAIIPETFLDDGIEISVVLHDKKLLKSILEEARVEFFPSLASQTFVLAKITSFLLRYQTSAFSDP